MIALASASDENKRLLNKIDSKSLLERCLKTTPLSQVDMSDAIATMHVRHTALHLFLLTHAHLSICMVRHHTIGISPLQDQDRPGPAHHQAHHPPGTTPASCRTRALFAAFTQPCHCSFPYTYTSTPSQNYKIPQQEHERVGGVAMKIRRAPGNGPL